MNVVKFRPAPLARALRARVRTGIPLAVVTDPINRLDGVAFVFTPDHRALLSRADLDECLGELACTDVGRSVLLMLDFCEQEIEILVEEAQAAGMRALS